MVPILHSVYSGSDFFYGESQYNLRLSKLNPFEGFVNTDNLSIDNSRMAYGVYHAIIHYLSKLLPDVLSIVLFGLVTGMATILLFYFALRGLGISIDRSFFACIIILFSPAFIEMFGTTNPAGFGVMSSLLGFMVYQFRKDFLGRFFAFIFFLLSALNGPIHAFGALVLLGIATLVERKSIGIALLGLYSFLVALIISFGTFSYWSSDPASFPFGLFSDLGFSSGIGIFFALTAIVGIYVLWKRKKEYWFVYASSFLLLILVFFVSKDAIYYLIFSISIFSSAAIFRFIEGEWEISSLKNILLLVVFCGFIFSFISYVSSVSGRTYDSELVDSLRWLRTAPQGAVLTAPDYGYLVQSYSEKQPLLIPKNKNLSIFFERNPKKAFDRIQSVGGKYIVIDNFMRSGLVWQRNEQGLLFALRDKEHFRLIYLKDNVGIWSLSDAG
ncbi:MAG: hypothetical protein AABX51_05125 [Nanoarchaeota archaeon]